MASTAVLPSLHIQTTLFDPKHVETPPPFGHDLAELRSGFNGGFKALPLDPLTQKQLRMFKESRELRFKEESGHITTLSVKPWHTMQEVRERLAQQLDPNKNSPARVRLFCRGHELSYRQTVDASHLQGNDTVHVSTSSKVRSGAHKLEVLCGSSCPDALVDIIDQARDGLACGLSPELTPSGLGGTYFLKNSAKQVVGVFKPEDEEAGGPNNPKGNCGFMGKPSVRNGVLAGEANLREVAAYMLDHQKFANVPATVRVEVQHAMFGGKAKVGSFQEFRIHDEEAGDLSSSLFSTEEAHKIAIMDVRLLNTDRNDENLLVKRLPSADLELIPIDHGCSLPSTLQVMWHDWIWLSWPQTKRPFSKAEKDYIEGLNASDDSTLLSSELNLAWRNLLMLGITTTFLQKGAAADLSLFDIASMMVRDEPSRPSTLESIFTQSRALAEAKRRGRGGFAPRRSPAITASVPSLRRSPNSPLPLSSKKGIRRTISSCDLAQLSAFSLPPSEMKSAPYKSKDDHTWDSAEEEQQQESFDNIFFECLHNLMDSVISQRLSKKRAMSIMTAAFKCSPVKDRIAPKVPQIITDLLCKEETEGGLSNSPRYARSSCKNDSECDPTPLQSKTNFETKKKLNFAQE